MVIAPGFMKYKNSIIDEYAELEAKVTKVETALQYAEYLKLHKLVTKHNGGHRDGALHHNTQIIGEIL